VTGVQTCALPIFSYSSLVADTLPKGSPQHADVSEIERAGQRAASLTRQLLALGRKEVRDLRVLDVNEVVADLRGMLLRLMGDAVELRTSPCDDLYRIEADPSQIEQIIVNLVVNASDAMPEGGVLTIATSNVEVGPGAPPGNPAPGHYARLSVSDTGVGIARDALPRIFEPFFTTKPVGKGTGMGLPTVLGIVQQCGGHVAVESEPSRGTTFRVYLPRSLGAVTTTQAPAPSEAREAVRGGEETILLVEDEEQVRALVRNVLRRAGYAVIEASEAEEALGAAARASAVDLLVTDSVLRAPGDRPLAARLGEARPGVKVLYLGGGSGVAPVGVGDGSARVLRKPITPARLLRAVRDVLDMS
jgi:two-component system, cell cycle sensor histidine kinase and response regulator CckA